MKYRESVKILSCEEIGTDIFSLRMQTDHIAAAALPGQFVTVYANDSSRLLPRPISICEADGQSGVLRLVFRIAGKGTEEFSKLREGDMVDIAGPLGNGFPLTAAEGKRVFLIGGGIGIPPMVETAKWLCGKCSCDSAADIRPDADEEQMTGTQSVAAQSAAAQADDVQPAPIKAADVKAILGYRDEQFLLEDFPCETVIATEDGSAGTKGNVIDAIEAGNLSADVIFACGPTPMLRALKKYSESKGIGCWLSLEEKMACGIGACLSCVCKTKEVDEHSQVKNARVCTEGPVFISTAVEL